MRSAPDSSSSRRGSLLGGGTDGNEQLTATAGAILFVLLAIIGLTILRIRQLISVHLFVGLVLLGPVALKLASTGYRFARYYGHGPAYRTKGPPELLMRLIAPVLVLLTLVVFVTGVLLLFAGPGGRDSFLFLHKVSFIAWLPFAGLHILGHLSQFPGSLRAVRARSAASGAPGAAGRWITVAGALVGGLVLAVVLIPDFAAWTAHQAAWHHHH